MIASRKPVTVAEVELAAAPLKNLFPDVATHAKLISGRNGAASLIQDWRQRENR